MSLRIASLSQLPAGLRQQLEHALPKKPSKYRNTVVVIDGERFDSKLEWRCHQWLKARVAEGELAWFTRQVPFILEGGVVYRADFVAVHAAGVQPFYEVIDATGMLTQVKTNKLKQMKARYGIEVLLWPHTPRGKSQARAIVALSTTP